MPTCACVRVSLLCSALLCFAHFRLYYRAVLESWVATRLSYPSVSIVSTRGLG